MSRKGLILICATALAAPLAAELPPLPVPLRLPPGLVEVIPVDTAGSYMGDAIRVVDCPNNADNPLGVCGNLLFGGLSLYNTHLTGPIRIQFFPPVNNISHFQVSHPLNLTAPDVLMRAPQYYIFGVTQNVVLDTFGSYSSGDLNLNTGEVTNLNYAVNFFNIFYAALGLVNPKLKPPAFTFPGIYGSASASFKQRSDGLLDFTFYGSTFLPLGNNIDGDPVRLPMPFFGPLIQNASIQVPGMSLHPHLSLTTEPSTTPACGSNCFNPPYNSTVELTLNARFSDFGDDFTLNIPQLGGPATGRSQLLGRIQMQFGEQNGDYVPVAINSMPPSGLLVPPPAFPINGLSLGFLGFDEHLNFPRLSYEVTGTAVTDDPFDVPVGEFNVKTGQFVGGLRWRTFWVQSLLLAILAQNNGRLLPASFMIHGPAVLQNGPNGETLFRYDGSVELPFDSFTWPAPDYNNTAGGFIAGPGSLLTPFFRMQAVLANDLSGSPAVMAGSQSNVQSSWGDVFSYNYSIPCDPAGKSASFTYTDNASGSRGGTFTMTDLASATCLNSLTSSQRAGSYDTVVFTGYGKWSKDKDPHIANVQVSAAPDAPYVAILIDGGTLSNVNTKPPQNPVP